MVTVRNPHVKLSDLTLIHKVMVLFGLALALVGVFAFTFVRGPAAWGATAVCILGAFLAAFGVIDAMRKGH